LRDQSLLEQARLPAVRHGCSDAVGVRLRSPLFRRCCRRTGRFDGSQASYYVRDHWAQRGPGPAAAARDPASTGRAAAARPSACSIDRAPRCTESMSTAASSCVD